MKKWYEQRDDISDLEYIKLEKINDFIEAIQELCTEGKNYQNYEDDELIDAWHECDKVLTRAFEVIHFITKVLSGEPRLENYSNDDGGLESLLYEKKFKIKRAIEELRKC